jgi:hypothetical protein
MVMHTSIDSCTLHNNNRGDIIIIDDDNNISTNNDSNSDGSDDNVVWMFEDDDSSLYYTDNSTSSSWHDYDKQVSLLLEQAYRRYLADENDDNDSSLVLPYPNNSYVIDFSQMQQTNINTHYMRAIRRRTAVHHKSIQ